ncbi:MAG: MBL fold metallo-hydrolase [Candidatus Rokuibacteriota bacterium]
MEDLLPRIDAGEGLLVLDVRNDEEFKDWRLEGRRPVETLHIPYFQFIEDLDGSMARVPREREVVVLCAQGGSSAMVVEMLRETGIPARNVRGGMVAYGEYLQPARVGLRADEAGRFEIWQLNRRGKGCLSYVIRSRDEAVVVDAARRVERYEAFVRSLGARIVRVFETHIQADHVSGGPSLAARAGVPYFVSAGSGFELRQRIEPLGDGRDIRLGGDGGGGLVVRIIETPGHTPGSTSYLVGERYLLTGDTIFVTSVGRPDLGGHVVEWGRALFQTLSRLQSLPDETVLLPAHYANAREIGPDGVVSGRWAELRQSIPELRIETEAEFLAAMRRSLKAPPASYGEIIRVNLGHANPTEEKVTEWELGKNQCAVAAKAAH